jgi:hypothetical protein
MAKSVAKSVRNSWPKLATKKQKPAVLRPFKPINLSLLTYKKTSKIRIFLYSLFGIMFLF